MLLEAGADVNQVCREPEVHCESPINRTIQYSTVHDNKLLMQLMPLLLAGKVDLYNSKPYPALEYAIRDMALPSVIEFERTYSDILDVGSLAGRDIKMHCITQN